MVGAHRPLAARRRRLARQLRAVQVRPAPLQRDRLDQLRPSRPVDLPGAARADRHARRRATSTSSIFPPRIAGRCEDTFRPPWFHRNVASEFMGLVHGAYDAKAEGFVPGGASLHNSMTGHGPDAETFEKASRADTSKPDVIADTMAFMFETRARLAADAPGARVGRAAGRLLPLLAGPAEALRPEPPLTAIAARLSPGRRTRAARRGTARRRASSSSCGCRPR